MNIVVTGKVGTGKTTVCEKVVKVARSYGYSCGGILAYKDLDGGIIVIDVQTDERQALASLDNIYDGPRTAKYFFNPGAIEFGIRAIERGAGSDILFVDEIGHLESGGGGFIRALDLIGTGRVKNSILVIRQGLLSVFSPRLDSKSLILETTRKNRNELPEKICSLLCCDLSPSMGTNRD